MIVMKIIYLPIVHNNRNKKITAAVVAEIEMVESIKMDLEAVVDITTTRIEDGVTKQRNKIQKEEDTGINTTSTTNYGDYDYEVQGEIVVPN